RAPNVPRRRRTFNVSATTAFRPAASPEEIPASRRSHGAAAACCCGAGTALTAARASSERRRVLGSKRQFRSYSGPGIVMLSSTPPEAQYLRPNRPIEGDGPENRLFSVYLLRITKPSFADQGSQLPVRMVVCARGAIEEMDGEKRRSQDRIPRRFEIGDVK